MTIDVDRFRQLVVRWADWHLDRSGQTPAASRLPRQARARPARPRSCAPAAATSGRSSTTGLPRRTRRRMSTATTIAATQRKRMTSHFMTAPPPWPGPGGAGMSRRPSGSNRSRVNAGRQRVAVPRVAASSRRSRPRRRCRSCGTRRSRRPRFRSSRLSRTLPWLSFRSVVVQGITSPVAETTHENRPAPQAKALSR